MTVIIITMCLETESNLVPLIRQPCYFSVRKHMRQARDDNIFLMVITIIITIIIITIALIVSRVLTLAQLPENKMLY